MSCQTKTCSNCGEDKSLDHFWVQRSRNNRPFSKCIKCEKALRAVLKVERRKRKPSNEDRECKTCHVVKPANAFYVKEGWRYVQCKDCIAILHHEQREEYKKANAERNVDETQIRKCLECKEDKPMSEYSVCRTFKSGINVVCRLCQDARHHKEYVAIKEYFKEWKMKNPCVVCGESRPELIEAAHIDASTKNYDLAKARSIEAFDNESKKCVGKCLVHHYEETERTQGKGRPTPPYIQRNRENVQLKMFQIGGCVKCHRPYDGKKREWHFDHIVAGDKTMEISKMVRMNLPFGEIEEEIDKRCQLLCCNCHRLETYRRYDEEWLIWKDHTGGAPIEHLMEKYKHTKRKAEEVIENKTKKRCTLERAYGSSWDEHIPGFL